MIKELIYLRDGINDRGVFLVSRVINSYFNKRIMYPVKEKKTYTKIYVNKLKKNVYEYQLEDDFINKIVLYKDYFRNSDNESKSIDDIIIEEYSETE
jgi:hypothetical protein